MNEKSNVFTIHYDKLTVTKNRHMFRSNVGNNMTLNVNFAHMNLMKY